MKEYINKLNYCPFCKSALKFSKRKSKQTKDVFCGLCPEKHSHSFAKENKSAAVWTYGSNAIDIDNCFLGIRFYTGHSLYLQDKYLQVCFYLRKNTDKTKIFTHNYAMDLSFNKIITFDFEDEEKFKQKLNTILLFS